MDAIHTLSIALGSSWTSGVNLYAAIAALGIVQRLGWTSLPGGLGVLSETWVIAIAVVLYIVEFFADKFPYFDSIWDVVHTFIRPPAGAILATASFADYPPSIQIIMFMLGGGVAATSHATKASTRAVLNVSPEPFSNWTASIVEDISAFIGIIVSIVLPILMILFVLLFTVIAWFFIPKLWRIAKRAAKTARGTNAAPSQ